MSVLPEWQSWILRHRDNDLSTLSFKLSGEDAATRTLILEQIDAYQRTKEKWPSLRLVPGLIFPPKVNVEQSSSEHTAQYKAQLMQGANHVLDATGGWGCDSIFIAKQVQRLTYVEPNEHLAQMAKSNFEVLGLKHIRVIYDTAERYMATEQLRHDWMYADPSRRGNQNQKLYSIRDYTPDIDSLIAGLGLSFEKALIKVSPMTDLREVMEILEQHLEKVHFVMYKNELKEILLQINPKKQGELLYAFAQLAPPLPYHIEIPYALEYGVAPSLSDMSDYLYDPHPGIAKAGMYKSVGALYQLPMISMRTHLYTHTLRLELFPGRCHKVLLDGWMQNFEGYKWPRQANVVTANSKITESEFRKKFKVKDGGLLYIYLYTDKNDRQRCTLAERIY